MARMKDVDIDNLNSETNFEHYFSDIENAVEFINNLDGANVCDYCAFNALCISGKQDCRKGIKKWLTMPFKG